MAENQAIGPQDLASLKKNAQQALLQGAQGGIFNSPSVVKTLSDSITNATKISELELTIGKIDALISLRNGQKFSVFNTEEFTQNILNADSKDSLILAIDLALEEIKGARVARAEEPEPVDTPAATPQASTDADASQTGPADPVEAADTSLKEIPDGILKILKSEDRLSEIAVDDLVTLTRAKIDDSIIRETARLALSHSPTLKDSAELFPDTSLVNERDINDAIADLRDPSRAREGKFLADDLRLISRGIYKRWEDSQFRFADDIKAAHVLAGLAIATDPENTNARGWLVDLLSRYAHKPDYIKAAHHLINDGRKQANPDLDWYDDADAFVNLRECKAEALTLVTAESGFTKWIDNGEKNGAIVPFTEEDLDDLLNKIKNAGDIASVKSYLREPFFSASSSAKIEFKRAEFDEKYDRDSYSAKNLAVCYHNGIGVAQDLTQAQKYYQETLTRIDAELAEDPDALFVPDRDRCEHLLNEVTQKLNKQPKPAVKASTGLKPNLLAWFTKLLPADLLAKMGFQKPVAATFVPSQTASSTETSKTAPNDAAQSAAEPDLKAEPDVGVPEEEMDAAAGPVLTPVLNPDSVADILIQIENDPALKQYGQPLEPIDFDDLKELIKKAKSPDELRGVIASLEFSNSQDQTKYEQFYNNLGAAPDSFKADTSETDNAAQTPPPPEPNADIADDKPEDAPEPDDLPFNRNKFKSKTPFWTPNKIFGSVGGAALALILGGGGSYLVLNGQDNHPDQPKQPKPTPVAAPGSEGATFSSASSSSPATAAPPVITIQLTPQAVLEQIKSVQPGASNGTNRCEIFNDGSSIRMPLFDTFENDDDINAIFVAAAQVLQASGDHTSIALNVTSCQDTISIPYNKISNAAPYYKEMIKIEDPSAEGNGSEQIENFKINENGSLDPVY